MIMFTARTIATNREFALGPGLDEEGCTEGHNFRYILSLDNAGTKELR